MPGAYGFTIIANNEVSAKMKEAETSISSFTTHAEIATKEVSEHFSLMGERMAETFKNIKSLLLTGLGITALFEGWELIEKSKVAFEALEKSVTRVDTVLKSTKFAAGFSSENIQDQSKELSKHIVNQRDEILDAQGMLLSFHDIKGGKFTETMASVADFATFYKENMTQAAMQVGKAINNPVKGYARLQRMGVEFSAEQVKQIKNYEAQGNLVKAQEVILRELQTEFGGQAAAYALTDAGKIQVASKAFTELQYKIGEIISRVEVSLIPAFIQVIETLKYMFNSDTIQFFIAHIKDLVEIILRLLPIWASYKTIMFAVYGIQKLVAFSEALLTSSTVANTIAVTGNKFAVLGLGASLIGTEGAITTTTVAMETLTAAVSSFSIGIAAIGIGWMIEDFISWNLKLDEAANKMTHLSDISRLAEQNREDVSKIILANSNWANLNPSQKQDVINNSASKITQMTTDTATNLGPQSRINKRLVDSTKKLIRPDVYNFSSPEGIPIKSIDPQQDTIRKNLENYTKGLDTAKTALNQTSTNLTLLNTILKKGLNEGIKPVIAIDPKSGIKADVANTSNLSGANGGLGQAKIIHIDFHGPFQQNNGVKESKNQADQAIEKMVEILNGFSDSINAQ